MAIVRVEPLGVEIDVKQGESIIEAAWRLGYYWPTVCYGQAECTACALTVVEGDENLSDIGQEEGEALRTRLISGSRRDISRVRLACRAEVHGPVVVEKRGVRPEN